MRQHIEFIHTEHFGQYYHRHYATGELALFVDFFWETRFDNLWTRYPDGFSDILFPNTGYTYLINLGTPFVMEVGDKQFPMKTDGFLPRHRSLECYHTRGNHIFGIKFRTSPIVFEKKINFAEYRDSIFPLSYLADANVLREVKAAPGFTERVEICSAYFTQLIQQYAGSLQPVQIVTDILSEMDRDQHFTKPVSDIATAYGVSARTLQRYFETHTGISTKKVLQIMRIRKAVEHLVNQPAGFDHAQYGYYDHSHFYKHLRQFLQKTSLQKSKLHVRLLSRLQPAGTVG
jgi:AraC-like DNA-binding protein